MTFVAENTSEHAEAFLASGIPSLEATNRLKQISRLAIAAKVMEEMQQDVAERVRQKEPEIEVIKSIDIEL